MKQETKNRWLNIAVNVGLVVIPAVTIAVVISLLGFALETGMKTVDPSYDRVIDLPKWTEVEMVSTGEVDEFGNELRKAHYK